MHGFGGVFKPYDGNARRWYKESQEKVLFWNHAFVNPPIDHSAGYVGYKIGNAVGAGLFLLAWGALFAALDARGVERARFRAMRPGEAWEVPATAGA